MASSNVKDDKVGQFANDMRNKVQEAGTAVKEKAGQVGSSLMETAKDAASSAAQTAGNVASYVGKKADEATSAVGAGMKSLGGTVRESMPHGGVVGAASGAVADTLESGGRYLKQHGLSGIGEDVTQLIRRNPIPALLVGISIGYLIARATRS